MRAGLADGLALHRLSAAKVTVRFVVFERKRQNEVSAPGIGPPDDRVFALELVG